MTQQEKKALDYYREKNYAAALRCFLKVEQQESAREDILVYIANCYDALGQKEFAAKYYKKTLKLNKKSDLAAANLAILSYEQEDFEAAEKYAKYAIRQNPRNVQALALYGNIYYRRGKNDRALKYYLEALDVQRDFYTANYNAASIYYDLHDYNTAYFYAKKTYQSYPESEEVQMLLSNICMELGKNTEALQLLAGLYAANPQDYWICNQLSQVCQQEGEYQTALEMGWHAILLSKGEKEQHINFGYLLYEIAAECPSADVNKYAQMWKRKYPENPVAKHMADAIAGNAAAGQMNSGFVKEIFDSFANDFESVLADLDYAVPGQMAGFLEALAENLHLKKMRILDAGCGTGLCAAYLKKYAKFRGLDGVDLSEKMLEVAKRKKLYTRLYKEDLYKFLPEHENTYDLINAADVFTYFGELENLFELLFAALKNGGRILFSISENTQNADNYSLHMSGRFVHNKKYVETLLAKTGFLVEKINRVHLRNEGGKPVFGWVIMARK